jgi:hypothetical protein
MWTILLLLLLLALGDATCPEHIDSTWARLVSIVGETTISPSKVDQLIASLKAKDACIPKTFSLTGNDIMEACDLNRDGVLTLEDWNHPSGCMASKPRQIYACRLVDCYQQNK